MPHNLDSYLLDVENYIRQNGKRALQTFVSRLDGKSYVVKKDTPDEVVLSSIYAHGSELTVSPGQFETDFFMLIQDEAVFLFGTKKQQEIARELFEIEQMAVKRCVYGSDHQLVVTSA